MAIWERTFTVLSSALWRRGIRCRIDGNTQYELAQTPHAIHKRQPQRISRLYLGDTEEWVTRPDLGVRATKAHTVWLG